jgi:hypothetical protein
MTTTFFATSARGIAAGTAALFQPSNDKPVAEIKL